MNCKFKLSFGEIFLFFFCTLSILCNDEIIAQISAEPVMPSFQQIPVGKSYDPANPFPDQWNYFPQLNNPLQAMKQPQQKQTQQQNIEQMQKFGMETPPTPEQIAKGKYYEELAQRREFKQKEFFEIINTSDNEDKAIDPKKLKELEITKRKLRLADTNSIEYKSYKKFYEKSYNEIVQMLTGKTPMDLKRVVFLVENPFYKNKLSYEKYCKQIDSLVFICKQILNEKGLSTKNYMACHYAIQKLFSENVYKTVTIVTKKLTFDESIKRTSNVTI